MKIYILTDLEGVSGVVDFDNYTSPNSPHYGRARTLLTGEVNAAIAGAIAGGAKEIVVWDGHGGGTSIALEDLHPTARLIAGSCVYPCGLDESFDAMFLVGNHAMEGTPNANLNHTYSSRHIAQMRLNGQPIGEIGMTAAMAGWFGVPTVFVSGDEAACAEARSLIPGIATAPVKQGLGLLSALCLHPEKARALIQRKAREGMRKARRTKPFKVKPPYELEVEFRNTEGVSWRMGRKGIEKVNAKTIRVTGQDFIEIMRSW